MLFSQILISLSLANPQPTHSYNGVDISKIGELKHQHFQSHQIGWSGIGAEGLTRVYLAPNQEAAALWIKKMKKRHYKSSFIELDDQADLTLWDEESVLISQFGLLLVLVQGERLEERREALQALFVEEEPVIPSTPEIILTADSYQLRIDGDWRYTFVGGTPIYTPTMIEFTHLPDTITVWNIFAQSHQFALQKQATREGILLFYDYHQDEVATPNKKNGTEK